MRGSLDDLGLAFRRLLRAPGFTAVTVAALALGIGLNTAIFSVVNASLLRPLPYPEPDRLVEIFLPTASGEARGPVSIVDFEDWRAQTHVFSSMTVFSTLAGLNLRGEGEREPERLRTAFVHPDFFATLEVAPRIGRPLAAADNEPGRNQAVVISHRFWQRRFEGAPDIAGRAITLDEQSFTVVGVMPETFRFPDATIDAWAPESLIEASAAPRVRGNRFQRVIARLDRGVSVERARVEMDLVASRLAREFPETNGGRDFVTLVPLRESLVGARLKSAVLVLLAAVGLVLLIACANVAHLLIARIASRRRETAIRLALGAAPSSIVRLHLAESLILCAAGGLAGLLAAAWMLEAARAGIAPYLPPQVDVVLDRRVLGFALLASGVAALLSGALPALRGVSRGVPQQDLKEGTRGGGASGDRRRLREALVVSEMAIAVVLVVAAGLALKSFARLSGVDPGFDPEGVLTVAMNASGARYPERAQFVEFQRRVIERVREIPSVVAAGATRNLPLLGTGESWPIAAEGGAPVAPGSEPEVAVHPVSAGFFAALRIPLLEGRPFAEPEGGSPVAIVSRTLARRFWPDGSALGRALLVGDRRIAVVGVVGDVRQGALEREGEAALYLPSALSPRRGFTLVIRTPGEPRALESLVRAAIRDIDPQQPILRVAAMREVLGTALAPPRLVSILLGAFGALAFGLALLGVYGVIALMVSLRVYEFGVRMALGATAGAVRRMVLGRVLRLGALGVAAGSLAALGLTRLLRSQLYDVSPSDPPTFLLVAAVLLLACLLAGDGPARRATRIDPLVALRSE